ncbi:MAG: signal peptidase I [Nocardioidaceae bacterium]
MSEAPPRVVVTRPTPPAKKRRLQFPAWLEFIVLLAIAIGIAVLIKAFFVQMFFVPSSSMRPTLQENDRILVQKISYWKGDIKRGDVIVFKDPGGQWLGEQDDSLNPVQKALSLAGLYPTGGHLVKRVIGIGGDHVKCCDKQGRITVNGVPLEEQDYIRKGTSPSDSKFDIRVPKDHLWVMGDNRTNSEDSRFHRNLPGKGAVPVSDVVGKVWAVVWPWNRMTRLHTPETFENPQLLASKPD